MKEVIRFAWLHALMWFRAWDLASAREFRSGLETTIAKERIRAKDWVEHAELMERRAYAAIVAARADQRITFQTRHRSPLGAANA